MADIMTGTIGIACRDCGTTTILAASAGRGGFLETGWRFDDLTANGPTFRCAECFSVQRRDDQLSVRKKYLAHMFEAQQRFGE